MLRHHPDGRIYINNAVFPLAWLLTQEPGYSLPGGMTGRVYRPGEYHQVFDGQNQFDGGAWPLGDDLISREVELSAAYAAHLAGPAPTLVEIKAEALGEIDTQAEQVRRSILTPGEGQMATYQRKEAEARAFQDDPIPSAEDYPFLSAEVGITGDTLAEVAAVILVQADAWWAFGAVIEAARLTAKAAVSNAAEVAAVQSVLAGLTWPEGPA